MSRHGRGGSYSKNYCSNYSNLEFHQSMESQHDPKRGQDIDGYHPSSQGLAHGVIRYNMPKEITMIESTLPHAIKSTIYGDLVSASAIGSSAPSAKPWSPIKGRVLDWTNL